MVALQHPLRFGLTQSPLKTSAVLMFLLFCTYPQNQASLFRVYVQKSPHCSCGLCDPVSRFLAAFIFACIPLLAWFS
jgi:hypothetical protein